MYSKVNQKESEDKDETDLKETQLLQTFKTSIVPSKNNDEPDSNDVTKHFLKDDLDDDITKYTSEDLLEMAGTNGWRNYSILFWIMIGYLFILFVYIF